MKNASTLVLLLLFLVLVSITLNFLKDIYTTDVLVRRNITCDSILSNDSIGYDISGWLRTPFKDGYMECSKLIPEQKGYDMPVAMNIISNCKEKDNFTYCSVGVSKEFIDLDNESNIIGKERVWMKLGVYADSQEINYEAGQGLNKLYDPHTIFHVAKCNIEEVHSEKE
jgi:hypothetical protein